MVLCTSPFGRNLSQHTTARHAPIMWSSSRLGCPSEHRTLIWGKTQIVNCWATVRTCTPGAAMWLSMGSGPSLTQQRPGGHDKSLHTGRTRHFILQVCCGARVAFKEVRRAKPDICWRVLAATTTVWGSTVLWVWMCEVVFHHSKGLLRHRHMVYLGPGTHDEQSSAPNHPSRDTAQVTGAA